MLNQKEQARIRVLVEVERGSTTVTQDVESMNLSVRQTHRILAAFRKEGAASVAHGNRGRQPAHTVSQEQRAQVVALSKEKYSNLNDSHLAEQLDEGRALPCPGRLCSAFAGPRDWRVPASAGTVTPRARTRAHISTMLDRIYAPGVQGMSQAAFVRRLGVHQHTVQKYLALQTPPERRHVSRRTSILTPYVAYIVER